MPESNGFAVPIALLQVAESVLSDMQYTSDATAREKALGEVIQTVIGKARRQLQDLRDRTQEEQVSAVE